MFKKLLRLAGFLCVVAAIVWLTRERMLPVPRVTEEPAPHYRSTPPPPADPDDLTEIKGIGPVYAMRLEQAGVTTFASLANADVASIAGTVGTREDTVRDWISQAEAQTP